MFILEGNIGAGKSTFLALIKKHAPNIEVNLEPIHNWHTTDCGSSLLKHFYESPKRWSYTFETFVMACRVKEHLQDQENTNQHRIIERSIYSGHYCFARNGYNNGFMSSLEWELYTAWFNFLIPQKCKLPSGFIYLRTQPEIAYERIKKRNRNGEEIIPLDYLKQIHVLHEQFLIEKKDIILKLKKIPVLILDCNKEFETDILLFNKYIDQVQKFIEELKIHK